MLCNKLIIQQRCFNPLWFIVFLFLQGGRVWVITSLGRYWTTRVITVPGAPLVKRGPYRWLRHPNYVVVVAEIAVVPLIAGAWEIALASRSIRRRCSAHSARRSRPGRGASTSAIPT